MDGHGDVEKPQVDRELPAVVDRVVQEDRPHERDPRHLHDDLVAVPERPGPHRARVVELRHRGLRGRDGLLERLQEGLDARGLLRREVAAALGHVEVAGQERARDPVREPRDVLSRAARATYDFACGFHDSLSAGTRDSTLRVVEHSRSNSISIGSIMRMAQPFRFPRSSYS